MCGGPPTYCASRQCGGVDWACSFRDCDRFAIVHFSGYRAQQCEERSSVAEEHQETRHRDLFQ